MKTGAKLWIACIICIICCIGCIGCSKSKDEPRSARGAAASAVGLPTATLPRDYTGPRTMPPGLTSQQKRIVRYWEGTLEQADGPNPAYRLSQCRGLRYSMPLAGVPTTPFIEAVCADVPVVTDERRAKGRRGVELLREIGKAYKTRDPAVLSAACKRLIPEAETLGGRIPADARGRCQAYQQALFLQTADMAKYDPSRIEFEHPTTMREQNDEISPHDTLAYCTAFVTACMGGPDRSLDDCFYSAPRCKQARPWESEKGWACCPQPCHDRYAKLRNAGQASSMAFMKATYGPPNCIPELNERLKRESTGSGQ